LIRRGAARILDAVTDSARLVSALDQLGATLRDLAPFLAAYHRHLCEQGLSEEAATDLVKGVQGDLLHAALSKARPVP